MKLVLEKIPDLNERTQRHFVRAIDINFDRLVSSFSLLPVVVREFVDASSIAQSRFLPNGNTPQRKDYYFVKTDSSANAVTIYAFGTQTIAGSASTTLAAQYDHVYLIFDVGSQTWYVQ